MLPAQRSRRRRAFERIARQVCGRSVGIALGSGAGWGLAHIGVLEVLDEAGIPVDYVAGASMGAIVGGHYALGIPPEEMRQFVSRVEKPSDFLGMLPDLLYLAMDFNVTRPGLFAGERFKELIASIAPIAGKTFADLEIPFRAIATDIDTGARAEICDGEVSEAVHASFAAPFILSPHRIGDGVYIDGGMVDPVPAEPVRHMGADLVIAVNVVPPLKKNVENPIRRAVSGSVGRLNPLRRPEKQLPGSFDVIARTLQLMQHQLGNDRAGEADVLIIPALEDFWVLEFWSGGPMSEKGAEAARAALPEIRERLESMRKTAPRASAEQAS
jgi:NTE family protein